MAYGGVKCYKALKKPRAPVAQWIEQPPSKLLTSQYATEDSYKIINTLYGKAGVTLTPIS